MLYLSDKGDQGEIILEDGCMYSVCRLCLLRSFNIGTKILDNRLISTIYVIGSDLL